MAPHNALGTNVLKQHGMARSAPVQTPDETELPVRDTGATGSVTTLAVGRALSPTASPAGPGGCPTSAILLKGCLKFAEVPEMGIDALEQRLEEERVERERAAWEDAEEKHDEAEEEDAVPEGANAVEDQENDSSDSSDSSDDDGQVAAADADARDEDMGAVYTEADDGGEEGDHVTAAEDEIDLLESILFGAEMDLPGDDGAGASEPGAASDNDSDEDQHIEDQIEDQDEDGPIDWSRWQEAIEEQTLAEFFPELVLTEIAGLAEAAAADDGVAGSDDVDAGPSGDA